MNDLQIFRSEDFGNIRTTIVHNEPWFVGKDVADILGYQNGSRDINRHVDEDDRRKVMVFDGNQDKETIVINESGLYSLILSSKMPNAKKFKHWVTNDILPTIRRHGAYMTDKALEEALTSPDFLIKLATQLKDERDKRIAVEAKSQAQEQIIKELKPKADYTDRILKNSGLVTITQIAKDYGMSGQGMNALLNRLCVQYKTASGQWLLYSKYQAKGYTHSKTIDIIRTDGTTDIKMETKWTQKGRLFLYEKLKKHGYLPMIEKEG